MIPLETERLILRNWEEKDRDLFHLINSDEKVMEFFPFRRTREQSDEMMDYLRDLISEHGYSFNALELKSTGETLGFAGLHTDHDLTKTFGKEIIEIGWRLAPKYWGKGYVTEAASASLDHGFKKLNTDKIFSFAVHGNHRSFAVMKRLGMSPTPALNFDHPRISQNHQHLVRHFVYSITKDQWSNKKGG